MKDWIVRPSPFFKWEVESVFDNASGSCPKCSRGFIFYCGTMYRCDSCYFEQSSVFFGSDDLYKSYTHPAENLYVRSLKPLRVRNMVVSPPLSPVLAIEEVLQLSLFDRSTYLF